MRELDFQREDLRPLILFVDAQEPSRRSGVHLVWANELIRASYVCAAPSVGESVRDPQGFNVIDLPALVRMKLTSFRRIDQVHIEDMLSVGLIDETVRQGLPEELEQRLSEVEDSVDDSI